MFLLSQQHIPLQKGPIIMKIKNLSLTLHTTLLLASFAGHAKEVKIGMAIDDLAWSAGKKIAIFL
jgi:D-xylose transport system substrate-binding protein